ncbi:MAG: ACT domain-containing protein [Bryobacteraceae bacterium]
MANTAILLIDCSDRKGLVAVVSSLLYQHGANILHADQHQDHEVGLFFMRVQWGVDDFDKDAFEAEFRHLHRHSTCGGGWNGRRYRPKVAIFVSQSCTVSRTSLPPAPGRRVCLRYCAHRQQSSKWPGGGGVLRGGVSFLPAFYRLGPVPDGRPA